MEWLYKNIIRKILFLVEPEKAHGVTLNLLNVLNRTGILKKTFSVKQQQTTNEGVNILGLSFKNKLGLAAGLDKNGSYLSSLKALGPGFIEIGTVTPKAQPGNERPRLFRLPDHQAIINRMGFNNHGVDNLIRNVINYRKSLTKQNSDSLIIGINIGKNFDTPIEKAVNDYLICLEKVYEHADYITVNISSPNTQNLRALQEESYLDDFLRTIKEKHTELACSYNSYKPLALKIAPDVTQEQLCNICDLCLKHAIDILIISNTTNDHILLNDGNGHKIAGGLSGKPLFEKSNAALKHASNYLKNINDRHKVYLIGVGGISSAKDAQTKFDLGADLVQVYSGLIYNGPNLLKDIIEKT